MTVNVVVKYGGAVSFVCPKMFREILWDWM